jgi:hypothetical protein
MMVVHDRVAVIEYQSGKAVDFVDERDCRISSASTLNDAAILRNLSFSSLSSMMESTMLSAVSGGFLKLLQS